jgi:hypothetical protein
LPGFEDLRLNFWNFAFFVGFFGFWWIKMRYLPDVKLWVFNRGEIGGFECWILFGFNHYCNFLLFGSRDLFLWIKSWHTIIGVYRILIFPCVVLLMLHIFLADFPCLLSMLDHYLSVFAAFACFVPNSLKNQIYFFEIFTWHKFSNRNHAIENFECFSASMMNPMKFLLSVQTKYSSM